ncbi:hypothetical protein GQ457_04G017250 [Hibiscus cannabinus]
MMMGCLTVAKVSRDDFANQLFMGTSSIGGLFQDRNDTWILGFTKAISIADVLQIELWALLTGLELGLTNGFETLEIQSDCKQVVELVNDIDAASSP